MTYQNHPTFGIREASFGMASYANAQYIQKKLKSAAQSAAIGDSNIKDTIQGFEKTIHMQDGVKTELQGAAAYTNAQTLQSWDTAIKDAEAAALEDDLLNNI